MSTSLRQRIRKRRDEEDDIMMMFLYFMGSSRGGKKQKRHTSEETGEIKVQRLLNGHVKNCQVTFRMEPQIFRAVATYLRRTKLVSDTRISVEEKLAFFLFMLSKSATYEDMQVFFGHSNDTLHRHLNHFFNKVIPILTRHFIIAPDPNLVHPKIQDNPRYYPFFQNCLGAIDGTHIPITISPDRAAPFRNRKGTLSINVMVACDFDLNITFISTGWEGSATDSRVLRSAKARGFHVPPGKFYLADRGYANTASFLAPYKGVRYHLKEFGAGHRRPQNPKELFNHRHAKLRNHVERTLGVIKKRFPILKVGTFHTLRNQVRIPVAAAIFHNLIRLHAGDEEWLNDQPDNIDPASFVPLPTGDQNNDQGSVEGNALRDTIAQQMWDQYQHHGSSPKTRMVAKGSPKIRMIARGSPKLNRLLVASATKKKASPKGSHASSSQVKQRAYWNASHERSLADILHENKDYRGDNGWSSESWNRMVKDFWARNKYALFSKSQIQEKERELKRDYKMLKEALKQSCCSWNKDRCMIEAGPHFWANLKVTFPKIKKFQNPKTSFPLFDYLGELYDVLDVNTCCLVVGHLAEGNYNITSMEPEEEEPLMPIPEAEDDIDDEEVQLVYDLEDEQVQEDELEVPAREEAPSRDEKAPPRNRLREERKKLQPASTVHQRRVSARAEKAEPKKLTKNNVEGMFERYLEMRTKQGEEEAAMLARENEAAMLARENQLTQATDFSITRCIKVLNTMQVTKEEKVKAFSVFKNVENREIFLSSAEGDEETALLWLRSQF
ncbi:hypothetical protein EJB05_34270, partial [Eragrostis curvula]